MIIPSDAVLFRMGETTLEDSAIADAMFVMMSLPVYSVKSKGITWQVLFENSWFFWLFHTKLTNKTLLQTKNIFFWLNGSLCLYWKLFRDFGLKQRKCIISFFYIICTLSPVSKRKTLWSVCIAPEHVIFWCIMHVVLIISFVLTWYCRVKKSHRSYLPNKAVRERASSDYRVT